MGYPSDERRLARTGEEVFRSFCQNAIMTHTYWEVGRRIVEHEQHGKKRAVYGEALIERLALDLTGKFGKASLRVTSGK
jgi:hypothetical protein